VDTNLDRVNYTIYGMGYYKNFLEPYNISASWGSDKEYNVQINAMDKAGNLNSSWFYFIYDSGDPEIMLNSPENNSVIQRGTVLDFSIFDITLIEANYSVNSGVNFSFLYPYNISTSGWTDEDYIIQIYATDSLGNSISSWFFFTIDSSNPVIVLNSPQNNSIIPSSTILDFSIIDIYLMQVNYSYLYS